MNKLIVYLLLSAFSFSALAQNDNTLNPKQLPKKTLLKATAIPTLFIIGGIAFNKSSFEKNLAIDVRNKVGHDFKFPIDDYFQYAPIAEMYIADAFGVKAKNHWFDQTKNLAISSLVTGIIVHSIKRGMNKTRPYGGPHSFPSGHTSMAFTGATVLYQEFKNTSPLLAYSGFAFATTTGTFRIINNAHWFSDVLAGAGISMLVGNLVYYIEPLKNFNPFKKSNDVSLIPYFNSNETGIYFCKKF